MKMKTFFALFFASVLLGSCQLRPGTANENEDMTAKYFESIVKSNDNAQLTLFFSQLPKGGDIHHHYSGAIYAETYLNWAADRQITINSLTYRLDTAGTLKEPFITIDSLKNNSFLYRAVLQKWSDQDFSNQCQLQDTPDQHFFNTFSYFGTISSLDFKAGLANIKARAKKENIQYIETMISSSPYKMAFHPDTLNLFAYYQRNSDAERLEELLNALSRKIVSTPDYDAWVTAYTKRLYRHHEDIDDADFTMRFQTYATRNSRIDEVFSKLYSCFDVVARDKSSLIVGVNFVGPENGVVALRDYWLHMQILKFLKKKFPTVKIALHAGELSLGMVKPEDLDNHISNAVFVAGASRIGHGVDLPYETRANDVLKKMKEGSIAIEINLTSNEFILGVKNEDHPINMYYQAGVPLVLSTDDAGVSRNNLTSEYVKLVTRYKFNYLQIKDIIYNSIKYSFVDKDKKSELLEMLDKKFVHFESKVAAQYSTVKK